MSAKVVVHCAIAALSLFVVGSASRSVAQVVIGTWESGTPEGWFDWGTGTLTEMAAPRFEFNGIGATLGTGALQFSLPASAYSQWAAIKLQQGTPGPPDFGNGIDDYRDDFMTHTKLGFDLTLVQSEMSTAPGNDYATINPVINADMFGFHSIADRLESVTNNTDNFFVDNHFNPSLLVGTRTFTITYDIGFTHDEGGIGADGTEINANPNYIELLFEMYSNGGVVYHLDNVRLFTPGLVGDFDNSNLVDGADLALWKSGYGMTGQTDDSNGDADGDGDVDGHDFVLWQRNVGGTLTVGVAGAVPEPAGALLTVVALAATTHRRRRARSR